MQKVLQKIILGIALTLMMAGCNNAPEQVKTVKVPVPVYKTPLDLNLPEPIDFKELKLTVITNDNADSIFLQSAGANKFPAYVCLTPQGYQNLSENQIKTETYILQLQNIIQEYKNYYESGVK